ncbi:branched-chain amino acid ABC transporter permease [Spartobacteria bacterium LR76]|nr:branched-chain amino acid ABC transporter permease [Spartobacteria bacterium LR76]
MDFLKKLGENRVILPVLLVVGFILTLAISQFAPLEQGLQSVLRELHLNTYVIALVGINVILCASLNLVNGYMGEFSVGHAGFMSLGAYASSIVTVKLLPDMPDALFFFPVIVGGVVAALAGFLLALLSFKTRGDYLAIITLAFLMIVKSALENIPYVGGPRGMLGIPKLTTLAWAFFWAVVTIWVLRNLLYSKFGRAIAAIREDEIAANSMGVRVREAKILAFSVSAFFAGVAGALFAHLLVFATPATFGIFTSTEILVMVYLGGIGSLAGSIIGAVVYTLLSNWLLPLGTWRMVIMPLILVLLMLFRPKGIMGFRELPWFLPKREARRKDS